MRLAAGLLMTVLLAGCATQQAAAPAPQAGPLPPRNPYLADSAYPIGHTNSGQVDSTLVPGPTAPSHRLGEGEIETLRTGPGHLANIVGPAYPDGSRPIWSNNAQDIVKMDHDSLRLLATLKFKEFPTFTEADENRVTQMLKTGTLPERLQKGASLIGQMLARDLASVYTLVDRDNVYYIGRSDGIDAYGDVNPRDPKSPIEKKRSWTLPSDVPGGIVGINMTYDGWLVLATDRGHIVVLSRDFTRHRSVAMPHAEESIEYNARMKAEGRSGYNWVRNSIATDEQGGIYVVANGWMQKIVWTGEKLTVARTDGAWAEPYANSTTRGSGSTPALVGFGTGNDRFVVISDGDVLMNLTLYWRDAIPAGTSRLAGKLPVTLGDPDRKALQSEQAVVVAGYDMVVVNNEPASFPPGVPPAAKGLLISMFGDESAFKPVGVQKFSWDPKARVLREAWVNKDVASPNCVPFVSIGSNRVYTVGARNGEWTLESMRLDTGATAETWVLGGPRYNTMFAGIYVDPQGRVIYGGMFGAVRLNPKKAS